ncbi:MAG: InlB B-repeat-containing protein [Lachnospiraceae bacterium]|nr:InlB B-repeat-containing protein [Lachnospiraceae bacterium]
MKKLFKSFVVAIMSVMAIVLMSSPTFAAEKTGLERFTVENRQDEDVDVEASKELLEEELGISSTGSLRYNSDWDVYSTNYFYNQLSSDEKALWDALDATCLAILESSSDITLDKYSSYYVGEFSGITKDRAQNVAYMFYYSNPQYYFIEGVYCSSKYAWVYLFDEFASGSTRAAATAEYKNCINTLVTGMSTYTTDLQKMRYVHDWICEHVVWADKTNKYDQRAYSVLCTNPQYTVCAGYAQAFELLMNAVGIDCVAVTSDTHEWNMVKVNGTWYCMDVTWDDYEGGYYYYFYNRNYTNIALYDTGTNAGSHTLETLWTGLLPANTGDSGGNYAASYYAAVSGTAEAPGIIFNNSNGKITIVVPSGCTVYYTDDNNTPSEGYSRATKLSLTTTFDAPSTGIVKAVSVKQGCNDSDVKFVEYPVYAVTFVSNGAQYYTMTGVPRGAKITQPTNPTRKGYTFSGWCSNENCTMKVTFPLSITGDTTLYAKWTGNKYKYTFKANGSGAYIKNKGQTTLKDVFTYGKTYKGLPTAKRSGYAFLGWYTKKSGGELIKASDTVTKAKNVTLYAHWGKIKTSKAKIASLKSNAAKTLTVKVKKIKNANGYQIRYSLKSSMKGAKTAKTANTENTKTITKLKSGKTYYVQVRMYVKDSVSGKVKYGSWSSKKKVKVK